MKPKELFGVAVRVIGLIVTLSGGYSILLTFFVGTVSHGDSARILFFPGIICSCAGVFLMR